MRWMRWVMFALVCGVIGAGDPASGEEVIEAPPHDRAPVGGFHMEGAAHITVVFGDARAFRAHVDRFLELDASMTDARHRFTRGTRAVLAELAAAPRRQCPTAEAAPHYVRAIEALEQFETLGSSYAGRYRAIRELDAIGDTAGLTPDYGWKVNRTRTLYRSALRDLREMRAHASDELARALRHQHCKADELLALGADLPAPPSLAPINPMPSPRRRDRENAAEPEASTPATFYVDNSRCSAPLAVYVDGAQLGTVQGRGRGAFRAPAGRHSMCLLPGDSLTSCGQQGTVRNAFVYDGWSISLHCMQP